MTTAPIPEKKPRWGVRQWQWVAVGAVMLVIIALVPALYMGREKARKISCASNIHAMCLAMHMYASDWNRQFPPQDGAAGWELIRSQGYCENHKMWLCPSTTTTGRDGDPLIEQTVDYIYFGGFFKSDDAGLVWACDKAGNHVKYGNATYLDGRTIGYGGNWDMMLARFKSEHEKVVGPRRQPALSLSKGAAAEKTKGAPP